jgi:hypothetical protein
LPQGPQEYPYFFNFPEQIVSSFHRF